MTTIVAVEKDGEVFFGADTQITVGGNQKSSSSTAKVFTNAGNIFGVAGSVEVSQVIKYSKLPKFTGSSSEEEYLTNKLIPAIKTALKTADVLPIINSAISLSASILVCVNHRAFQLSGQLAILNTTDGLYAIGSGAKYALGALHAGASIQKAIEIASQLDLHTNDKTTELSSKEVFDD